MHLSPHPTLIRVGWGLLWIGVLTPLAVSLSAAYVIWQGRCTSDLQYTFVPLLISCGPRSWGDLALGAIGTIITCCAPIAATIIATVTWFTVDGPARRVARIKSGCLGATALLVSAAMVATFASTNSPAPWGTNAWILFAATAGVATLTLCTIINAVVVGIARSNVISGHSSRAVDDGGSQG